MSLAFPFVRQTASAATRSAAGVAPRRTGGESGLVGMLAPARWGSSTFGNNAAANFWNSGVPAIRVRSGGVAAAASEALVAAPGSLVASPLENLGIWLSSTLKKRKTKMNKHKLQKRRKKLRLKSK